MNCHHHRCRRCCCRHHCCRYKLQAFAQYSPVECTAAVLHSHPSYTIDQAVGTWDDPAS